MHNDTTYINDTLNLLHCNSTTYYVQNMSKQSYCMTAKAVKLHMDGTET